MSIVVIKPSNTEMQRCVARAADIRPTADGFPDSGLPGCHRWLYNYLGFAAPDEGVLNPVGATAKPFLSHMRAGFGVAFVKALPGNGVPFHAHDTNETFMCLEGEWRCEWEGSEGVGGATLAKYDLISFPPGVQRRFECTVAGDAGREAVLLGVIAGDAPSAEYSPEAVAWMRAAGRMQPPANAAEAPSTEAA